MAENSHLPEVLGNNPSPIGKGSMVEVPDVVIKGSKLPAYVKCCVCGKPPVGADWLKPVNRSPNCRKFVHLSHINDGPGVDQMAGFILRNS